MAMAAAVLVLAGCSSGGDSTPGANGASPPGHVPLEVGVRDPVLTSAAPVPPCDPSRNLTPSAPIAAGAMPQGSTMRAIQDRGALVVGVDQNTRMFAAPSTGADRALEGFDIDLAREVARAIFGDPTRIRLKTIPPGKRLDVLVDRQVDMVVHAMTITCERWQQVDFSGVYLEDSLRLLVPLGAPVKTLDDLAGQYVCVSSNTTPEERVSRSKALVYAVSDRTDCLVALQEGRVSAVYTNESLLKSLAEQDPLLEVVGPDVKEELKGIALPKGQTDFTRFLNGTLERIKADGRWQAMYDKWLAGALGKADPPKTTYSG